MNSVNRAITIGTRKSELALWQTEHVKRLLQAQFPAWNIKIRKVDTRGDQTQAANEPLPAIGGKGLFTAELEEELARNQIDLAVHSLKDLPTAIDQRFSLGAICRRGPVADVLVSRRNERLLELPQGSVIGTSSVRRLAQLKSIRPDLIFESIRGNVGTRIRKIREDKTQYAATVLAHAGVYRLGYEKFVSQIFSAEEMLPAPGQGALAVQCRADDQDLLSALALIDCRETRAEVTAERKFLEKLDGGCNTPVACLGRYNDSKVSLKCRCLSSDGNQRIEVEGESEVEASAELGAALGQAALERGFKDLP